MKSFFSTGIDRSKSIKLLLTFSALFIVGLLNAQTKTTDMLKKILVGRGNWPGTKTKPAAGKDTAAVLAFNTKPAGQFAAANVQEISGTWEGEQSNGNQVWLYKLCLTKVSGNTYSGVDYCVYYKSIDHYPAAQNGATQEATKSFIGKFDNGELDFTEIQNVDNSKWTLVNEHFKFVDDNGSPAIINDNASNPGRKFYLKRTSQSFPQEYLKYAINENTLQMENPVFKNSKNEPVLRFNDHGTLSVSVKNNSSIDLSNIKGQVTTSEQQNGIIDYDKLYGNFNLAKNAVLNLPLQLTTNFSLPRQEVHLNVTFSYGSMVLAQKTLVVPTESFYKTATVTVPEYTSSRMKAVSGYYGLLNTPFGDVSKQLEPLVASGDKMAAIWKAVFLSMGYGEYKIDEAAAYGIGKANFNFLENKARNGDGEALYLMFYACQIGLEGESGLQSGGEFLEKSASAGFLPALYDEALQHDMNKDYSTALSKLIKIYDLGVKEAAHVIGFMYERGLGDNKDVATAIKWYDKGIAFGDPEAGVALSELFSNGFENTAPDINKAMSLATAAAAKNCTEAMIFLGMKYFNGRQGIAQNIPLAIKWFKAGADLGDRQSMLALGETYLSDEPGMVKDENSGLFNITKAAELGSPKAMMMLAKFFNEGTLGKKNIITGRYWYNQAVLNGYAQADVTGANAGAESFMNFWKYADFSPSYVYVDEGGHYLRDGDDGLFNGLFTGIFGAMSEYYGHQQQLIDGLEYIYKKNGYKIYGGTVSSSFFSNLYLKAGQTVNIKSYGIISTGMMSGSANADGLGNAWPEYRIVPAIPCSAVMAKVKDGNWQFIGQHASYTSPLDGQLTFALNAIDYQNYKGYFDIVVQVPEN